MSSPFCRLGSKQASGLAWELLAPHFPGACTCFSWDNRIDTSTDQPYHCLAWGFWIAGILGQSLRFFRSSAKFCISDSAVFHQPPAPEIKPSWNNVPVKLQFRVRSPDITMILRDDWNDASFKDLKSDTYYLEIEWHFCWQILINT